MSTNTRKLLSFAGLALISLSLAGLDASLVMSKSSKPAAKKAQAKPLPLEFYQAARLYNEGKYKESLGHLQHLDASGHCCDKVHYYIALDYHGMNQTVPAEMNYEWVCNYSKDKTLQTYANSALEQIAYYQGHRTYGGQGNNFSRAKPGGGGGGG